MLLLWLLLFPSARATIDCKSACGLCSMDTNSLTAACTLCRECHRVHRRMMGPRNQMHNNKQDNELKALERREFRQVMKEYGWVPDDLADSDSNPGIAEGVGPIVTKSGSDDGILEKSRELLKLYSRMDEYDNCLPPQSECINDEESSNEVREKLAYSPTTCPTLPATQNCPPTKSCKKKLDKKQRNPEKPAIPSAASTVALRILKQIVNLRYETIDQGSPTQKTYPDSGSSEHEKLLNEDPVTQPSTKTTCRPGKLKVVTRKLTSHTIFCVPCMPLCPLPCGTQVQNSPILPSIPPEALAALMTLKPTTIDDKKTISTQTVDEKIEKKIQKLVFTQTSKVNDYIEDTTKDYVYLYVGIPKHEHNG